MEIVLESSIDVTCMVICGGAVGDLWMIMCGGLDGILDGVRMVNGYGVDDDDDDDDDDNDDDDNNDNDDNDD